MTTSLLLFVFPVLAFLSAYLGAPGVVGILLGIVGAALTGAWTYSEMPTLAWDFSGLPGMLLICGIIGLVSRGLRVIGSNPDGGGNGFPAAALTAASLAWFGA